MAGHSKWANIKHRKAAQDNKRGKIFTKIIRELVVAARQGGGNPAENPALRAVVDKALSVNMTRDTINRAIDRGVGNKDGDAMERVTYEGYGPSGVAIMVECLTDNRNRTVAEVRHAFTKYGGNLGTDGSVSYLFNKKGQFYFQKKLNEDELLEAVLEFNIDDIRIENDYTIVLCDWTCYFPVMEALEKAGLKPDDAEIVMLPTTEITVSEHTRETVDKLVDMLEELDDVQQVFTNLE